MKKQLIVMTALLMCSSTAAFATMETGDMKMMADKHMKMMDMNSDGMVSKDEFMTGMEKKFSEMDANSDGMMSKEEMMNGKMKEMKMMKDMDMMKK